MSSDRKCVDLQVAPKVQLSFRHSGGPSGGLAQISWMKSPEAHSVTESPFFVFGVFTVFVFGIFFSKKI